MAAFSFSSMSLTALPISSCVASLSRAEARVMIWTLSQSSFCWLSCGAQPDSQTISKVAPGPGRRGRRSARRRSRRRAAGSPGAGACAGARRARWSAPMARRSRISAKRVGVAHRDASRHPPPAGRSPPAAAARRDRAHPRRARRGAGAAFDLRLGLGEGLAQFGQGRAARARSRGTGRRACSARRIWTSAPGRSLTPCSARAARPRGRTLSARERQASPRRRRAVERGRRLGQPARAAARDPQRSPEPSHAGGGGGRRAEVERRAGSAAAPRPAGRPGPRPRGRRRKSAASPSAASRPAPAAAGESRGRTGRSDWPLMDGIARFGAVASAGRRSGPPASRQTCGAPPARCGAAWPCRATGPLEDSAAPCRHAARDRDGSTRLARRRRAAAARAAVGLVYPPTCVGLQRRHRRAARALRPPAGAACR